LPALERQTARTTELAAQVVRLLSSTVPVQLPLARGSARERVVNFLLDLSRRQRARDCDATRIKLSMTRCEIANLLDTRVETVSRVLQQLHREAAIQVRGNRIRLMGLAPAKTQPPDRTAGL
jgi:CRP/FNR family transcriptional regulator